MSYTVLARRYRSDSFEDVVGQEAVAQTLKNAIATDRVAHAYLFTGTRGVGKTSMARILAKAMNCLAFDKPTTTPCCKCESCLAISEGEDIDVLEIDGASNTGVEHIRELRQNAIYRPARARFKIYIIDEVHMLSVSAFNALLKTLEEPPDHVKFILATTEPNKILATILSRCQRFDFRNIQMKDIARQLQKVLQGEGVEAEEALVRRVARLANGSMRDALSLLDQILSMSDGKLSLSLLQDLLGTPRSERIIELVSAIGENDLAGALNRIDLVLQEGLALEQLAEALQNHFRDLMILRNCGAETELVELDDEAIRTKTMEQSKLFDDAALVYNITVMEELRRAIKSSGSSRALLEAAIVRLTANDRFSDTKAILEQIQNLQAADTGFQNPSGSAPSPQRTGSVMTGARPAPAAPPGSTRTKAAEPEQNPAGSTPAPAVTLEYLQNNWSKIMLELSKQGRSQFSLFLNQAQPIQWQNNQLTIEYPSQHSGNYKFLSENPNYIQQIEQALQGIFSSPVKLVLAPLRETADPAHPANGHSPIAPGAKPSQKEIDAAISDPKVKQVQEVLGGKVKSVERSNYEIT